MESNPYGATTIIRPAETPSLCLEEDRDWSLLLDASAVVILDDGQVREIVHDFCSQLAGGPFEDERDADRVRELTDAYLSQVAAHNWAATA